MNKIFERAQELFPEMQENRRHMHMYPEVGLDLPETKKFVKSKLEEIGVSDIKEYGSSGLSAIIEGDGDGKTLLLRADMDALPMVEDTDLEYESKNEGKFHGCGHDLHTSMLLGAAKILMENKDKFSGRIKLMFQPGEEIFKGSKMMIKEGILENPKVDAAIALHTALDEGVGSVSYDFGYMTTSSDNFKIDIIGKGGHGAYPHTAIDPINAAVNIYQNFAGLISRENPPTDTTILTFGELSAGSSSNVIPERAIMQGTMRTYNPEAREKLKNRMLEIVEGVAKTTACKIELDFFAGVPSVYSDPDFTKDIVDVLNRDFSQIKTIPDVKVMASEDMADVSLEVPTAYMMLNCQVGGNDFSHHNPGILFDEKGMIYGSTLFATAAIGWLKENK